MMVNLHCCTPSGRVIIPPHPSNPVLLSLSAMPSEGRANSVDVQSPMQQTSADVLLLRH